MYCFAYKNEIVAFCSSCTEHYFLLARLQNRNNSSEMFHFRTEATFKKTSNNDTLTQHCDRYTVRRLLQMSESADAKKLEYEISVVFRDLSSFFLWHFPPETGVNFACFQLLTNSSACTIFERFHVIFRLLVNLLFYFQKHNMFYSQ